MTAKDVRRNCISKCNSCQNKENYPNCDCETRIIREAVNKQISIKAMDIHESDRLKNLFHGKCPICKSLISTYADSPKNYCDACGHKILWMR